MYIHHLRAFKMKQYLYSVYEKKIDFFFRGHLVGVRISKEHGKGKISRQDRWCYPFSAASLLS